MQNKRDQVQAHMFLMGRLTSSMLRSDPDAPESPLGRTNRGIAIGVIVTVLVAAGVFVVGLISPGTQDSWRTSNGLIVDKDTGARYLYLDGRLRPVRNYASARLLGGAGLETTTVGSASLKGTPRGTPVGIPGAPDDLPAAGDLSDAPWQVCATHTTKASGAVDRVTTTLAVAHDTDGTGLGEDEGLLVAAPDGTEYLLWQGSRLRLDAEAAAEEALGYASVRPVPVSAAFLDALPAGPDLSPPDVPGLGTPGRRLGGAGTTVGQVFVLAVPGAEERHYVLREDGLAPLTATELALLLGDPRTREKAYDGAAPKPLPLNSEALRGNVAATAGTPAGPGASPQSPPKAVTVPGDRTPCAFVTPAGNGTRVGVALATTEGLGPVAQHASGVSSAACLPVDRVTVPPGHGALVRAVGAAGGDVGGTVYLVTETGVKYRLTTKEAVEAFGYQDVPRNDIPALLLAMLPSGPDLHPEAAEAGRARVTSPRCAPRKTETS
ncbi:type VII secretion protein EccB [Streptomyces sp. NPDC018964]|uniref:type VII secretion protein EccB n=1 Tax=Streptomyces sp. NPDC018964 TaxID=3365058 RepID=UPI0037925C82